jgi:hypothetical protein
MFPLRSVSEKMAAASTALRYISTLIRHPIDFSCCFVSRHKSEHARRLDEISLLWAYDLRDLPNVVKSQKFVADIGQTPGNGPGQPSQPLALPLCAVFKGFLRLEIGFWMTLARDRKKCQLSRINSIANAQAF